jgi:hypothetical protein
MIGEIRPRRPRLDSQTMVAGAKDDHGETSVRSLSIVSRRLNKYVCFFSLMLCVSSVKAAEPSVDLKQGLAGYWPLAGDTQDKSGHGRDAMNQGVELLADGAAFNGRDAFLEIAGKPELLSKGDFSLSLWIHTAKDLDDVPGDLVSQYDAQRRRGFQLSLKNNAGVTFNQANYRQLQFGIDDNRQSAWTDCGRPGKAWIDCGAPANCNAVTALAVFDGKLYAGTGKYRLAGSALTESENTRLGGKIFRYEGGDKWSDCGQLPEAEAVGGMVVFRGRLYASSLYRPAGFYRYEGDDKWTDCGTPDGKRVEALGVYNSFLYATSYDGGRVYRYDGKSWTDCGQLGENTQTYSFAVHDGRLFVGTWPSGRVYRFEEIGRWTDMGRLGEELEVMGMLVHNGRLLAGTLPLAEVYEHEGDGVWRKLARLDPTPEVKYRRAWTAAEFQGRLYFSTLPSGKIFSYQAGACVTHDHELPSGWQHVVAIKAADRLQFYVNGVRVAESASFNAADYDLTSDQPLRIGFGANDYFCGKLRDVRLYERRLNPAEIGELAKPAR